MKVGAKGSLLVLECDVFVVGTYEAIAHRCLTELMNYGKRTRCQEIIDQQMHYNDQLKIYTLGGMGWGILNRYTYG